MDKTVLVYIEKDDSYLMLLRNKKDVDMNKGKWLGVGGHIEQGETKEDALVREVKEETNLDVVSYKYHGEVYFYNKDYEEVMYLYTVNQCMGTLKECDEGTLKYIKKSEIETLNIWEGDRIFLRLIRDNAPTFRLKLYYSDDKLIDSKLEYI